MHIPKQFIQNKLESGTKPNQIKEEWPDHRRTKKPSNLNSLSEMDLLPSKDQHEFELGMNPNKKSNHGRAKKSSNLSAEIDLQSSKGQNKLDLGPMPNQTKK